MLPTQDDLAWIRRFRLSIVRDIPRLQEICRAELDRPEFETLMSDIVPLLDACRWHERHAKDLLRSRRIRHGGIWRLGQSHTLTRRPIGHVAIIATWNYPYNLLGTQLVQAIAAGNRVTVKPSERSPRAHNAMLAIARESGLDEKRLITMAPTREAGRHLLEFGQFDHVLFTGSTNVGRSIASTLADSLTPSTLELSGADSAIVLEDADVELAAESIFFAFSMNAGQSCMAPRRVIVEAGVYDRFVAALRPLVNQAYQERRVDEQEANRLRAMLEKASTQGSVVSSNEKPSTGATVTPAAVLECPPDSEIATGEHFAPAIAVLKSENRLRTKSLAQSSMKSLTVSVFTQSPSQARRLTHDLDAGFVTINDCMVPTAHPGVSIGGRGMSGWGVSQGELGLLAMTRPRFVSKTSKRVRIPTKAPSTRVQKNMHRLVRYWYSRK
jgi:acyl-CoA reductase-like NAD-dependent aldehyde dehydrogenase